MDIMHLDSQAKDLYTKTVELYGEELTAEDLEPLALYASEYYALSRGEIPTDTDATRLYNDYVDAYTGGDDDRGDRRLLQGPPRYHREGAVSRPHRVAP